MCCTGGRGNIHSYFNGAEWRLLVVKWKNKGHVKSFQTHWVDADPVRWVEHWAFFAACFDTSEKRDWHTETCGYTPASHCFEKHRHCATCAPLCKLLFEVPDFNLKTSWMQNCHAELPTYWRSAAAVEERLLPFQSRFHFTISPQRTLPFLALNNHQFLHYIRTHNSFLSAPCLFVSDSGSQCAHKWSLSQKRTPGVPFNSSIPPNFHSSASAWYFAHKWLDKEINNVQFDSFICGPRISAAIIVCNTCVGPRFTSQSSFCENFFWAEKKSKTLPRVIPKESSGCCQCEACN